ncbi:LysR family transcriptional regulator [Marinomonas epiphytica]
MISPVFLRTFCTLAEVGHYTKTAQLLNMTQSGVSQHIKKLEEQFAVALFVKQSKPMSLTDAGERLFKEAQEILFALEELKTTVGEDPHDRGLVRLASPGSVGLKLYPNLLALQQGTQLVVDYRLAPNNDVLQSVADHKVDIGLVTSLSEADDLNCRAIATEELCLITAKYVQDVSWQGLVDLGFINHPDGFHHGKTLLGENFKEFKSMQQFSIKGFSNQIGQILLPVSMGLGFTVLPRFAFEAFSDRDRLKVHTLDTKCNETIFLVTHRYKNLPNRVKLAIREIELCLK